MPKLRDLSRMLQGELNGNPDYEIVSVNSLHRAGSNEITFAVKDGINTNALNAGALIIGRNSHLIYPNIITVDNPYAAFAFLLEYFNPRKRFNQGLHPLCHIAPDAVIGKNVSIGPFSYIGEQCSIGDETEIHAGVCVYRNVSIGAGCLIYSNTVIREDVEIGNFVIIQPGAVIGSDGFGYTRLPDHTPIKIPQKGKVVIGDHCEIGANACIDRSTIEETLLKEHVKLDNLVQVGHNVKIGRFTAISALTGISGSVDIGENVIMGGQVGIADHVAIADNAMIASQSGVTGHLKQAGVYAGSPHQDFKKWRRNFALFRNLEGYIDRIKHLEDKLKDSEEK